MIGDMQAFDLVRIEEHFQVDIGREKKTKAYQVLDFLNSTTIKNLNLRNDDDAHDELRVACVKFIEKKIFILSYTLSSYFIFIDRTRSLF